MGGTLIKPSIQQHVDKGYDVKAIIGDAALPKIGDSPVQTALKAAGKVIEGGSDIITAPAVRIKDMQKNWLTYMVVLAIIMLSATFLYCTIRGYFLRKRSGSSANSSVNSFIEFAKVFAGKTEPIQPQLPMPVFNSSSNISSPGVNLDV
ncbi:unnamed protein product [Adineta steineri]|uniref:Uncharacterized protein n=1 Tax=Adineta steineri TaxID=433720 RepID=A0A815SKL4_9BILA|nr:unnamed protein product [Adineta steineri]